MMSESGPRLHIGLVAEPFVTSNCSVVAGIRHHVAEHVKRGGFLTAVVSDNRDVTFDGVENRRVDYHERCPREWFTGSERLRDAARGRMGLRRRCGQVFVPAIREMRDVAPDVVVVYQGSYALQSLPLWRETWPEITLAISFHNAVSRSMGRRELRHLLSLADLVVFVSDHDRRVADARAGGMPARALVSHNALDHLVFHPRGRTGRREQLRVTFAGEAAPHKGPHLLLEALAHIEEQVSLTIVGGARHRFGNDLTGYERLLRDRCEELGLAADFQDFVPPGLLAEQFRNSDVVVVPSDFDEPFGKVAIEAMACGVAVIASPRGGLPEACGGAAVLVEPTDTRALARAISAMADLEHCRHWQDRGIARAQKLTWEESYDRLHAALAEARVDGASRRRPSVNR